MLLVFFCVLGGAAAYPFALYSPWYSQNFDTASIGGGSNAAGGATYSRYYQPYRPYNMHGGMAAVMYTGPSGYYEPAPSTQEKQIYLPPQKQYEPEQQQEVYIHPKDRPIKKNPQKQVFISTQEKEIYTPTEDTVSPPQKQEYPPPQQNEVVPTNPQDETYHINTPSEVVPLAQDKNVPDSPQITTEIEDKVEVTTLIPRTSTVELASETEQVIEEFKPTVKPRRVAKKKVPVRPVEEEDDEEVFNPKVPMAFFPMYFGFGRNGGAPGGATAIANAYSTGKGGVASSHATAYGSPRQDEHR